MRCGRCNSHIPDNVDFCPYCGERFRIMPVQDDNNPRNRSIAPFFIIFIAVNIVILSAISVIFVFNRSNAPELNTTEEEFIVPNNDIVVFSHELTMDKVIELAELKHNLSWEHFGMYDFIEYKYDERTDYQMITYMIEDRCNICYLVIKGIKGQEPDDILFYESKNGFKTDIRDTEDFEKFRNTHLRFSGCD